MNTPVWTQPPLEQWTQGGPVRASDGIEVAATESQSEARLGSAAAMGLFGFCVGTAVVAWTICGFAPYPATLIAAVPSLLVFAGIGQFIAGLYAFARTNSWAGTAMCSYGANNCIVAMYIWMQAGGLIPATPGNHLLLGIDLFVMGFISLTLMIGAMRINSTFVMTTLALVLGYTLTGIMFVGGGREIGVVGGYCLLASVFFAGYAAAANVINSSWQREVLPLFSLRRS